MFKRYHQDNPFLDVILVVGHVLKGKKRISHLALIVYSTIMLKLWLVGNQSTSLDEAVGPLSGPQVRFPVSKVGSDLQPSRMQFPNQLVKGCRKQPCS